jgi:hypothetical protein
MTRDGIARDCVHQWDSICFIERDLETKQRRIAVLEESMQSALDSIKTLKTQIEKIEQERRP